MFTVDDVLAATGGSLASGQAGANFTGVTIDSRSVEAGDLFVAFRGQKHDGHRFVLQAFSHGARGALVESLLDGEPWAEPGWSGPAVVMTSDSRKALQDLATYWRAKHRLTVIGVTG